MVFKLSKRGMEKSIEMVFVILVTLIVAVVAIKMFTGMVQQASEAGKEADLVKATQECKAYCDSDPMSFCSTKFAIDLNGDRNIFGVAEHKGLFYVCEDTVPCFVLEPECRSPGYKLDAYGCARYLCGKYAELYQGDFEEATLEVFGRWMNVDSKSDLLRKDPQVIEGKEPPIYKGKCHTNERNYWWNIFVRYSLKDVEAIYSNEEGVLYVTTPEGDEIPLCQYIYEGYAEEGWGYSEEEGGGEEGWGPGGIIPPDQSEEQGQ